jgi:DNA-binding CsgD family transcriptional regulator
VAASLLAQIQPLIAAEDTDELVADRVDALIRAGRGQEAEDLVRSYLPRATSAPQRSRLHDAVLTSLIHRANTAAAQVEIANLLAFEELPEQTRAYLLGLRSWILVLDGHLDLAAEADSVVLAASGSVTGAEHDLAVTAALTWLHGQPITALRILGAQAQDLQATPTAAPWDSTAAATSSLMGSAHSGPVFPPLFLLYAVGPAAAEKANAHGRQISLQHGFTYVQQFHDYVLGNIYHVAGRWEDALAAVDAGLEMGEETGSMGLSAPLGAQALIEVHQGKRAAARVRLERVTRNGYPPQFGRDYAALAGVALAEADAIETIAGSSDRTDWDAAHSPALVAARRLWDDAVNRGGQLWIATIAGYVLRLADSALGDEVTRAVQAMAIGQMPILDPVREQVLGLHGGDHQRVTAAGDAFLSASHPLAAGFAWEEAGLLAARLGASTASSRTLKKAVEVYDQLGAASDLARMRARAQRLGIRTTQPRARARPTSGWESLTPTEHTVAGLVREGLTNPQIASRLFLSPRTIQTHVSHILQKTQLKSRVEIAALSI